MTILCPHTINPFSPSTRACQASSLPGGASLFRDSRASRTPLRGHMRPRTLEVKRGSQRRRQNKDARGYRFTIVAVAIAITFLAGAFSGLFATRAVAWCDRYDIDGPDSTYVDVTEGGVTAYVSGKVDTYMIRNPPCTEAHWLHIKQNTFASLNCCGHNIFWLISLPSGVEFSSVTLDSDEWIADGGVGESYVYIGQSAGNYRYPYAHAQIPSSYWGEDIEITMRMAANGYDCNSPFTTCGAIQTYVLTG